MIKKTAGKHLEYLIQSYFDDILRKKDKKNLSGSDLETLYAIGYNHFTLGNYRSSKAVFTSLTSAAPDMSHYWRALGAVNQQMENYKEGIAGYDKAIEKDSADTVSHVYRAECYILIGQKEKGLDGLKNLLQNPKLNAPSPWVERAKIILLAYNKKEGKE